MRGERSEFALRVLVLAVTTTATNRNKTSTQGTALKVNPGIGIVAVDARHSPLGPSLCRFKEQHQTITLTDVALATQRNEMKNRKTDTAFLPVDVIRKREDRTHLMNIVLEWTRSARCRRTHFQTVRTQLLRGGLPYEAENQTEGRMQSSRRPKEIQRRETIECFILGGNILRRYVGATDCHASEPTLCYTSKQALDDHFVCLVRSSLSDTNDTDTLIQIVPWVSGT